MRDLLKSLSLGTNVSAVLIAVATFAIHPPRRFLRQV